MKTAVLALVTTGQIEVVAGVILAVWLIIAGAVADYGRHRGHPFFPLFVCSLFLGFPLVLLAVAVAPRGRRR